VEKLLNEIILMVVNSGLPVLLANLAKNFFPKMDGKTDKIVNGLVVVLFAFGWFYGYYNQEALFQILPVFSANMKDVVEIAQVALTLLISLGLTKPIYELVKNKIPLLGKSFSKK